MDVLDASYDSVDEVDEDAELELSCALQDLATRCKSFSAKMTEDLPEIEDGEVSEDEDLPRFFAADDKAVGGGRRPRGDKGTAADDGDEYYNQTHEELTSIQSNIKHLLEKLERAATTQTTSSSTTVYRDFENDNDAKPTTNGRFGATNQRQEK
ncbi:hypothetical protein H310_01590 [Aphanomyces invadans]|uniref:Uncharacterized protein n=1 Tax=Aphanomyces invadans TaxID=157072 RepID=A0A024URS9_9STRA|nr:hypothetical protein H310_01590 [Aphanomyces invadans]ETW09156.1 hypothetical protein H310_01590 [Aphanomyces invadans]RHY35157.1 hypothetical protein DYB32_000385 [Aphanomyces invadans]|eukprot:XP_008862961.1 hypothetical protein H310_01590 [Aphanomyces invadans]